MIISHLDKDYHPPCENGAHIYSELICKYFVPNIVTGMNWNTINVHKSMDNSIVFIHSNLNTVKRYGFLKDYKNQLLICSQQSTCRAVENLGTPVYLPLSIDVDYVQQFITTKDRYCCYAGRRAKADTETMKKNGIDILADLPHDELLKRMARYHYVYAVGLTALEAKCLNCNVLPYDQRFPNPAVWKVRNIKDMIPVLQNIIDIYEHKVFDT